jgi:hypothetical protein
MYIQLRCAFEIAVVTDLLVLLLDCDEGASVTNDVESVVSVLSVELPGGVGHRRVYYRDSLGRFDEILVKHERFCGFRAGSRGQQNHFWGLVLGAKPGAKLSGAYLGDQELSPRIPF